MLSDFFSAKFLLQFPALKAKSGIAATEMGDDLPTSDISLALKAENAIWADDVISPEAANSRDEMPDYANSILKIAGVVLWNEFIANPTMINTAQLDGSMAKDCPADACLPPLPPITAPREPGGTLGDYIGSGPEIVVIPYEPPENVSAKDPFDILEFILKLPTSCLKQGEDCAAFGLRIQGECFTSGLAGLQVCGLVGNAAANSCSTSGKVKPC